MTNPHDRLIRETLQDKEDAISFFKNSLPEKVIELLDLEPVSKLFVLLTRNYLLVKWTNIIQRYRMDFGNK
ncbi:transposase, YhgA-like domain protein [Leptospira noguchii str. 1993005606]|uniref:Transposase, YhgA-like domain protein n=2 Tax=Leptospira noguchii TaxID=28182 RepID=A0ABN0J3V3_9LEPT|nr:transposase, YhgA-like domain protein [Leptospira noguchii str. 2007001578]EMN01685.1 transposase, YhgA-like domain protein [Leptospira noguchii str. 2007001578]EPE82034.1 transposase, YhgA-like domain protein [Leptospira noguchii str. 1993005606]